MAPAEKEIPAPPQNDHLAPGSGMIDFGAYAFYGAGGVIKVFEPAPAVPADALAESLRLVRQAWSAPVS